jgi:superfamily II DNA or RNA helicase
MKNKLVLRDYQTPKVIQVLNSLKSSKVVFAGCPGSGKTEMAIYIIKKYIDEGKKVLVLAHSTNVLKDNFEDRWNNYFNQNPNLTICIPQSYKKDKYDLVIIDEAHENYLAKQVQLIVSDIPEQLLLTGTPSKFVGKEEYKIFAIAMADLDRKFFSKTAIELVTTSYNWSEEDYNQNDELKTTAKISKLDTEKSIEIVLDKLIERVIHKKIDAERFNKPNLLTWIKKVFSSDVLGKTMIVCKRKKQADWVNNYLLSKGYKSNVSHAESDMDSKLFDDFKQGVYDVLVVVNRGRLGFSDDNLMNIIDMSGTKNPDLIYQMFARVVRGKQEQNKLFIKLSPSGPAQNDLMSVSTQMALSLMFEEVITMFNGKNMNGMFIPVIKQERKQKEGDTKSKKSVKKQSTVDRISFPQYTTDVIVEMSNVWHSMDKELSVYKKCSIDEVIISIKSNVNKIKPNGYWNEERISNLMIDCIYKIDLYKKNNNAYSACKKYYPELFSKLKDSVNRNWNEDEVIKVAENCNWEFSEFIKYNDVYIQAQRKYPDIIKKLKRNRVAPNTWNENKIKEVRSKYKSFSEFISENQSAYNAIRRKYPHLQEENDRKDYNYYTKENILKEIGDKKFKKKTHLRNIKKGSTIYTHINKRYPELWNIILEK